MSKNTVIYYFHGREVGLPTGGMPRYHKFSLACNGVLEAIEAYGFGEGICEGI